VDGVAAGGGYGAEVVDHLAGLQPRGADREQEGRYRVFGDRERVTGVEQVVVDHEAGVLYHRDVLVDQGVLLAVDVHGETRDFQGVAVVDCVDPVGEVAELRGYRGGGPEGEVWVTGQGGLEGVGVEVVYVLVGDEDRGGAGEGGGRVAEGAGVDDQDCVVLLQPHTRVAKLGEPHQESPVRPVDKLQASLNA
jgi:hypothetical protein